MSPRRTTGESTAPTAPAASRRRFRAGDILVACDNVSGYEPGYMGHSAIVVKETELVESPGGHPAIRRDTVQQFLDLHPLHIQFRPRSATMGREAAGYALDYLAGYERNLQSGIEKPVFSFDLSSPLDDPWTKIYCSKLVWLCYHFGADYTFPNDHLWFSPEDLYRVLSQDPLFAEVYRHPEFQFKYDS